MELIILVEDIKQIFITKQIMKDEILVALNKVIQRINMRYKGKEVLKTLNTSSSNTGYNTSTNALTIDKDVTKLQNVYVDDYSFANVDYNTFINASSSDYVCNVIGNKVYFLSDYSESTIKSVSFEIIPLITTGTGFGTKFDDTTEQEIDIPTVAYEVLFTGAVYALASKPKYYNKLIHEEYRASYYTAFKDFEWLIESIEPYKNISSEYSW